MNGGVRRDKVAAFRLVPYIARDKEALQKLISEWTEEKNEQVEDEELKKEQEQYIESDEEDEKDSDEDGEDED